MVEGDNIILGPDVACIDLKDAQVVLANGWENKISPLKVLPVNLQDDFLEDKIELQIISFKEDGSLEIQIQGKNVFIPQGQEYTEEVNRIGLVNGRIVRWQVRNFGTVRMQCYPDFVSDPKEKERKLFSLAQRDSNDSYCKEIVSSDSRRICFQNIAQNLKRKAKETGDFTLCQKIDPNESGQTIRSECLKEIAIATKRSDICLLIDFSTEKRECFHDLVSLDFCKNIEDQTNKDDCYYGLRYCEYITNQEAINFCYINHMGEIWNRVGFEEAQQICDDIGPTNNGLSTADFNREVCYQELAKGVALKNPQDALILVEKFSNNLERQGIMYKVIAEAIAPSNPNLAREICSKITVNTTYASKTSCLQYIK